jgi:O-antigen/teichoic acid export membrane protein
MYFHKQDVQGISSLRILLLGFISLSMFILTYQIYFSVRLKKSLLIILSIGVVLNLLLNYLYLPQYGIIASAWASSICYTLVAILSFLDLYYLKKGNYKRRTLTMDEERE